MFTLLRKIRKSLIESLLSREANESDRKPASPSGGSASPIGGPASPLGGYFFYAVGEIFLVVIGILIALQINNWNLDKQAKRQEEILLTEMSKNLERDLANFEHQLKELKIRRQKVKTLSSLLKKESIVYHDSLLTYFGAVYGVEPSRINAAIYEDLKSRGFELINDDDLRLNINQFFEEAIYRMDGYLISEQSVNDEIKPYYLKYFQDIKFRIFAKPIDADLIINDVRYKNLVDYRLINLESNQLTHHPWLISEMKRLIEKINRYLTNSK